MSSPKSVKRGGGPAASSAGPRAPRSANAPRPGRYVPAAWSAALALLLLGVYTWLTPGVAGGGDGSEIVLALATCGVMHPTGYPVYTLAGSGFVHALRLLGFDAAHAANLFSALGGAVAMFLLHRLALRFVPPSERLTSAARFAIAALPVLLMAFQRVWLPEVTLAEVHSWQLAWWCGTALLFVRLLEAGEGDAPDRPAPAPLAVAFGALAGLGLAHHLTSVFWVAAWSVGLAVVLLRARRLPAATAVLALGAGLVPVLSYGYLAFRAAHPGGASVWPVLAGGWDGMLAHVTGSAYRQNIGQWLPDPAEHALLRDSVYPFLWPGLLLLAVHGARAKAANARLAWWGLLVPALLHLAFVYRYGVNDPQPYFIPPLAAALLATVPLAAWPAGAPRRVHVPAALAAGALLAWLAVPGVTATRDDDAAYEQVDATLLQLFRSVPFEQGIVLWPSSNYYRLKMYQQFQHEKPALDVYATAALCNDLPRARFRRRYGFDPMAEAPPESLTTPIQADFSVGAPGSALEAVLLARVHRTVVDSAGVPVALFNPPTGVRVFHGLRAQRGR